MTSFSFFNRCNYPTGTGMLMLEYDLHFIKEEYRIHAGENRYEVLSI